MQQIKFGLNIAKPYKYIIWFVVFFLLNYLGETIPNIAGLSFNQLWKLPVLAYLLMFFVLNKRKKEAFEVVTLWLVVEYFLCREIMVNPFGCFIRITKQQLPFVLLFSYWYLFYRNKTNQLEIIIFCIAQYVAISCIPFLLDIIPPLKDAQDMAMFGVEGSSFSAIFGSPHAASAIFGASMMVLVYGFSSNRFTTKLSKFINAVFIGVLLISIFKAYTRTGWLMLLVSILFYFDWSNMKLKHVKNVVIVLSIISVGLVVLYNTNDAFYARLTGRNVYSGKGGEKIDVNGSGRTDFWVNAAKGLWNSNNAYYFLFGRGMTMVVEENYRTTGMKVFSHNQFMDSLAQNGIFGLSLLLAYYFTLFGFIRKKKSKYGRLCISLYMASIIFAFFQSEIYFFHAFILSLAVALHGLSDESKCKKLLLDK